VADLSFLHSGDARKLLADVEAARTKAMGLIDSHVGGPFSWALDAFRGRLGYWLHVSIVQAWNEEERRTPYATFAKGWLADDRNVLLAVLATERQNNVDACALLGMWLKANDAATHALVAADTRKVLRDLEEPHHG
jgi:hypothetical protein